MKTIVKYIFLTILATTVLYGIFIGNSNLGNKSSEFQKSIDNQGLNKPDLSHVHSELQMTGNPQHTTPISNPVSEFLNMRSQSHNLQKQQHNYSQDVVNQIQRIQQSLQEKHQQLGSHQSTREATYNVPFATDPTPQQNVNPLLDKLGDNGDMSQSGLLSHKVDHLVPNDLHPDVKIVPSFAPDNLVLPYKDCIPLPKSPKTGVWICVHPVDEDEHVSGALKNNRLWEEHLIRQIDEVLKKDPSLMLLDLGCNIGVYTLWAAAMGRQVVAVEMLMSNVHLVQTSLRLSGLTQNVTIVNNALFSDHRTLETKFLERNIGGSRLNTSKSYEKLHATKQTVKVQTICMDDLLPLVRGKSIFIKMDIENSEHNALACAHKLFNETNITAVQMEWLNRTPEESNQILQFMSSHGYVMSYSSLEYKPVTDIGPDIYFVKKSMFLIA